MTDAELAIIFVPGIRPKPPADTYQEQLRRCLVAGVKKAAGSDPEAADIAGLFDLIGWSFDFYGEHRDPNIDMPGIERLLAGEDRPEDDVRAATTLSKRIAGGLYVLWDRLPFLAELLATPRMETRLREMRRYFNDRQGAAGAAKEKVRAALRAAWDADKKVLLIGHSFGSVIAYDVLWEYTHERDDGGAVDLFVTMGSPLTLNYMRKHLKGASKRGRNRYPDGITRWINLAAVGEVTALDRELAFCFKEMLTLGLVSSIEDNMELVNQFHGPDGLNVHKCYGYYASPVAGKLILDWYRQQAQLAGDVTE